MVKFINPVSDLITSRTSWRSCTGEAIPADKLQALQQFAHSRTQGLFGHPLRIELVAARENDSAELKGLGTYGFIRGASGFLVGAVQREINNLEDYGRLMEEIVLKATELELATCWLGGSFQKDNFSARIHTQPHEVVPAVVSVGVFSHKRNLIDRGIRSIAGSRKRKPWEELFFLPDGITALSKETAGEYAPILELVRLAPSASNKQPWRVIQSPDAYHFFLKRTPGYHKPKLFSDLQRVDMGIASCHFELACQEHDLSGRWIHSPPDLPVPAFWEYSISWQTGSRE
jgi:nitroreductase